MAANQFSLTSDIKSIEAEVEAIQQCDKCCEVLSHTFQQHFKSHPGQDFSSCVICHAKNFKLGILHLSLHTKLIGLNKKDESEQVVNIIDDIVQEAKTNKSDKVSSKSDSVQDDVKSDKIDIKIIDVNKCDSDKDTLDGSVKIAKENFLTKTGKEETNGESGEEDIKVEIYEEEIKVGNHEEDIKVDHDKDDIKVDSDKEAMKVDNDKEDIKVDSIEEDIEVDIYEAKVKVYCDDVKYIIEDVDTYKSDEKQEKSKSDQIDIISNFYDTKSHKINEDQDDFVKTEEYNFIIKTEVNAEKYDNIHDMMKNEKIDPELVVANTCDNIKNIDETFKSEFMNNGFVNIVKISKSDEIADKVGKSEEIDNVGITESNNEIENIKGESESNNSVHECEYCGNIFTNKNDSKMHTEINHQEYDSYLKCDIISMSADNYYNIYIEPEIINMLEKHGYDQHENNYIYAEDDIESLIEYDDSLLTDNGEIAYFVDNNSNYDSQSLSIKEELLLAETLNDEQKDFSVNSCKMKISISNFGEALGIKCDMCNEMFKNLNQLKQHIQYYHESLIFHSKYIRKLSARKEQRGKFCKRKEWIKRDSRRKLDFIKYRRKVKLVKFRRKIKWVKFRRKLENLKF